MGSEAAFESVLFKQGVLKICKIFKNAYFEEHLRTTATVVSFPIKNRTLNIFSNSLTFSGKSPKLFIFEIVY